MWRAGQFRQALAALCALAGLSVPALAQPADFDPDDLVGPQVTAPERCQAMMIQFPSDSLQSRYEFFRMVNDAAEGADDDFIAALEALSAGTVPRDATLAQVVEMIASPVLRQGAPSMTVGYMGYLVGYGHECGAFIEDQIAALEAAEPNFDDPGYHRQITENALFMKSILVDALYRLEADVDPAYGAMIAAYERGMVHHRDEMEFAEFDAELAALEEEFMGDLGQRLELSNQVVGSGMDGDITSSSIGLSSEMSRESRREAQEQVIRTWGHILNGY